MRLNASRAIQRVSQQRPSVTHRAEGKGEGNGWGGCTKKVFTLQPYNRLLMPKQIQTKGSAEVLGTPL